MAEPWFRSVLVARRGGRTAAPGGSSRASPRRPGVEWLQEPWGECGMRLSCLLGPGLTVAGDAWQQVEITALTADSREVRPGTLFVAVPGSRADGRSFIDDAVARGAAAVLSGPVARRAHACGAFDPGRESAAPPRAAGGAVVRAPARVRGRGDRHQRQDLGRRLHPPDLDRPRARRGLARHPRPGSAGAATARQSDHAGPGAAARAARRGRGRRSRPSGHGGVQPRPRPAPAGRRAPAARRRLPISHAITSIITRASPTTWRPSAVCSASSCRPRVSPCSTPISRSTRRSPSSAAAAGSACSITAAGPSGCGCDAQVPDHLGQDLRFTLDGREHRVRLGLVGRFPGDERARGAWAWWSRAAPIPRPRSGRSRDCAACAAAWSGSRAIRRARRCSSTTPIPPMRSARRSTPCGRTPAAAWSRCSAAAAIAIPASGPRWGGSPPSTPTAWS